MLEAYSGACELIHVKDFRIAPLPAETYAKFEAKEIDMKEFYGAFLSLAQFAEVGQGNMNWPALLPAAEKAGAEYFLIEQDDTYGRDPIDCIRDSRRSEEHTSELQSRENLVCRLLLEKKKSEKLVRAADCS